MKITLTGSLGHIGLPDKRTCAKRTFGNGDQQQV